MIEPFTFTPPPANLTPEEADRWHVRGSHKMPGGGCCHCGPRNHLAEPQYACDHRPAEEDT